MRRGNTMRLRRVFSIILAVCVVAAVFLSGQARAADELVPFITPPAGGGAYIIGVGMISVTNKYISNPKMVHEAATGTMDIVRRMMQREAAKTPAFGIFGTVDAYNAYKGETDFKGKPFTNLRMVVAVNGTDVYFVVPANSPIKSYADAKGKRLGMGGPGSTPANTALFLLEQYGVAKKDFKPYFFTYKETVEGIQDGSLDGGFLAGGYPIASYNELATQRNVRIVPVDEATLKKILTDHPYYYKNVVKAKSYKGLEQDTTIMGFAGALWTHSGASTDYVYSVLKNLFDHKEEFYSIHTAAKEVTLQNALSGLSVPLHPGAEKYYREMGVLKK
jgi:TRAP transporter TAXI family solute receptor